jgi:hypothetical protein
MENWLKKLIRGLFDLTAWRLLKVTKTLLIWQLSILTCSLKQNKIIKNLANSYGFFVFVLCKLTAIINEKLI